MMEKKREFYSLEASESVIRKVLEQGGTFRFYPRGRSMHPIIREGKDCVILKAVSEQVKKYEAVLYKRRNGAFVLHRIVDKKDDCFVMRGDNQYVKEYGITPEQLIGVVCVVEKDEKRHNTCALYYRCGIYIWVKTWWIRKPVHRVLSLVKRVLRRTRRSLYED